MYIMKRKYLLISLFSGAVALTACKEKTTTTTDETSTPAETAPAGEPASKIAASPQPTASEATASVTDRAAKLGFAQYIPKNIATYGALYNGKKAFENFLQTAAGAFILERMEDEGMSMDDLLKNEQMAGQLAFYGEEHFVAYGESAPEAVKLGLNLFERVAYYGSRTGVYLADTQVREGDVQISSPLALLDGPLKGSVKDLITIFAKAEMPAYYQGAKVSDAKQRELLATQIADGIAVLKYIESEAVEEVTLKRAGNDFTGYKISGAKLSETLEALEEGGLLDMAGVIDPADIDVFKTSLAKKNLVIVSGVVDDYVIFFAGKSVDDFVFVDKVENSVCANEKMHYIDSYLEKDILYAGFKSAEMSEGVDSVSSLVFRMIGSAVKGAGKGLSEASALGDTRDVEALLESLVDQGEAMISLFTSTDTGYVAYLEDGIKIESYGGSNMPGIDFTKTNAFAPLESGEGTLLFANWTGNESYNEKVMNYVDTLGETSYLMSQRVAALDIDNGDFLKFKQGLGLFDAQFSKDVMSLWAALRGDLAAGLGAESAVIVDVNGSFPRIPNVPEVILKEGKVPRIAYVSEVVDRAKLKTSWDKINTSAENILKTVSNMAGKEIPMQVPMSSEKNDLKTWFIPLPFQNDDFVPSVSVSDKLFFASTSKKYSESLAESFANGDGYSRKGAWLHVDFTVFNNFAQEWLELVEANADEVFADDSIRDDFMENREKLITAMKAFETLKKMTMHTRREGGRIRISMHLQAN